MNLQQINSKADEIIALANSSRNLIKENLERVKAHGVNKLEIGIDSYSDDGEIVTELTYLQINDTEFYNGEIEEHDGISDLLSLYNPVISQSVKVIADSIILLFHGETNQLFKLI